MSPTVAAVARKPGSATNVMSRTSVASNTCVRPVTATRRPLVAMGTTRSVVTVRRTKGLEAVMKGSPWLGRSKRRARLTQGSQRYPAQAPPYEVKSQRLVSSRVPKRAPNDSRTVALAAGGRMPPRGRRIVWSDTTGRTARPSTVAAVIRRLPMRARTEFSSSRSIGPPERLAIVITSVTAMVPVVRRSVIRTS